MSKVVKEDILDKNPGMGMNVNPFESEIYLDLTSPLGSLTGQYYSLMFQLGKNGFAVFKIDESIDVSPSFKQYYDLTIQQRATLEAQMKAGLGQIATAIHDYELIWHDLRKYKEYMDYFTKIDKGGRMEKSKKKEEKEQGEQMRKEGVQLLKSVFIDQVDAHTGEGIALRTITQRWPTIIVDFMRLKDSDTDQKKIAKDYTITEAEGAVLATKNKIFIEWRDGLFKPTLGERYQNILRLVEARRNSIQRYTEALKPVITRFKLINDALEGQGGRKFPLTSFFQLGSQAWSLDHTRVWAFLPFGPSEKYKVTRDYVDEISLSRAGFRKDEIEEINAMRDAEGKDPVKTVNALPVEPSVDELVRKYWPKVEKEYNVQITISDIFEARKRLSDLFMRRAMETVGGRAARRVGDVIRPGATWVFSPYFVFLDIPYNRAVLRMPNGNELENLMIENMTVQNRSQNVVIVTLLEVIAREKQLENYISRLLGETGVSTTLEGGIDVFKPIKELAAEQYPEFYGKEKKEANKFKTNIRPVTKQAKNAFGDLLNIFGLKVDWLRARGPYEFAMDDRLAEVFQQETMYQGYLYVLRYLQRGAGVPGIKV